jgi:hypothetical protein
MTREELYALVWSQPMQTVAKSMGISDVALAKQCRRANIPVPPRGWWAKKAAGKPVKVQPLPPALFVLRNYFPALEPATMLADRDDDPVEPVFRDLAIVTKEITEAVGTVQIPKDLSQPHPIIARLLQQDEGRKKEQVGKAWMSDFWGPKFVSTIQQRRLRFLTGLFRELERLGCKVSGNTHAGERFSVRVGSSWAYINCSVESEPEQQFDRSLKARVEWLRLDITEYAEERGKPKKSWLEKEAKLETQAREIVLGFLMQVEQETRSNALWRYNWAIQDKARREQEAKLAAERAQANRIAQEKAAREAQIKALVDGANAFEKAARMRRYVAAVKEQYGVMHPEEVDRWAAWALATADKIDPLISGEFLEDIPLSNT